MGTPREGNGSKKTCFPGVWGVEERKSVSFALAFLGPGVALVRLWISCLHQMGLKKRMIRRGTCPLTRGLTLAFRPRAFLSFGSLMGLASALCLAHGDRELRELEATDETSSWLLWWLLWWTWLLLCGLEGGFWSAFASSAAFNRSCFFL